MPNLRAIAFRSGGRPTKFGIFCEHQLPRDWDESSEHQLIQNSLEQIELADRRGFDYAWEVEHHFLEEYSHEDICSSLKLFAEAVMPEFQGRHAEHEAWKAAVLNGEIVPEDIDTDPFDFTARQAPTQKPSKDRRNMVAGVVGRPDSTTISA